MTVRTPLARLAPIVALGIFSAAHVAAAQPRPDVVSRTGGLGSILGNLGSGTDWPSTTGPTPGAGTAPRPAPPATRSPTPRDRALDAAIATLARQIAHARSLTPESATVTHDGAQLEGMALEFRSRYETMRDRLYLGDPAAGTPAAEALAAFDARWGSLAAKLWAGDRGAGLISVPDWDAARSLVRATPCPIAASIPDTVATGVLDGPAWACTMNAFFADLAGHEARANLAQATARARALMPLAHALDALDAWIARTQQPRRDAPENPLMLRMFSWRVLQAWIEGATARHDELVRLRKIDPGTPFQRFLAHAPEVPRPEAGSATIIRVSAGASLHARLGSRKLVQPVIELPYAADAAGLARELHDVHYQLSTLDAYFDRLEYEERRSGIEAIDDRPLRLATARRTLEGRLPGLLRRIAAR